MRTINSPSLHHSLPITAHPLSLIIHLDSHKIHPVHSFCIKLDVCSVGGCDNIKDSQYSISSSQSYTLQNCRHRQTSLFLKLLPRADSAAFLPSTNQITLWSIRLISTVIVCPSFTAAPPLRELPFSHTLPLQELQATQLADLQASSWPNPQRVVTPTMMLRQLVFFCLTLNWQVLPSASGTLRMKLCQRLSLSFFIIITLWSPRYTLKQCQCGLSKKLQNYSRLNFLWNSQRDFLRMPIYCLWRSLSFTMLFILKSFFLYSSDSYSASRFISATSSFISSILFSNSTVLFVNLSIFSSLALDSALSSLFKFSNLTRIISLGSTSTLGISIRKTFFLSLEALSFIQKVSIPSQETRTS